MKLAIISDIHSNTEALKEVLTDIDSVGVDQIVCCGDIVGYGPDPHGTLALFRERHIAAVVGNHDAAVTGRYSTGNMSESARVGVLRHREQLTDDEWNWLHELKYVYEGDDFACTHGTFYIPSAFNYMVDPFTADTSFNSRPERWLFVGHVHITHVFTRPAHGFVEMSAGHDFTADPGARYLIDVGSVGYPRVESCSTWVSCDTATGQVAFHRLPFDFAAYKAACTRAGFPPPTWMNDL